MQVIQPRLVDDANDGERLTAEWDHGAEGVARWEEPGCDVAIDHGFAHILTARRVERTSGEQPHPHQFDVVGANADDVDEYRVTLWVSRVPWCARNRNRGLLCRRRQRQRGRGADSTHTRHTRHSVSDAVLKRQHV